MANRTLFAAGESIGSYTVDELLGPGHHYVVFKAHDAFGLTCALKVLLSGREGDRRRESTLANELTGLRHEHLAAVHGVVELEEVLAVVTDFVDGPSLRRWLGAYRPTPDEVLALFRGVLAGVDALHQAGHLHGAVNPGNVLLGPTDDGLVTKVADYGVVLPPDERSIYASRYLAPEVFGGEREPDERSDIWSLGCLLYELASGRPPFDAVDREVLAETIRSGKVPAFDSALLGLPLAVEQAIGECLRLEPALRPVGCDALSELLYGNTIVRRIAAKRDRSQQAADRGTAFASAVGLAVARSLGAGEGSEPPGVRASASVEAVARRSYKPQPEPEAPPFPLYGGLVFAVIGFVTLLCAGGIFVLTAG